MTEQIKCRCGHYHTTKEPKVCTLAGCTCITYDPQTPNTDYYINVIRNYQDFDQMIRYVLQNVPGARDLDEWDFIQLIWHYYLGVILDPKAAQLIGYQGRPDTIARAKRKICEPERKAYFDGRLNLSDAIYLPTKDELISRKGTKEEATVEYATLG